MTKKNANLYCFLLAIGIGIILWLISAPPPYGPIDNELSDNYWGFIIDIAHKWRNFNFSFWDRGVGGGVSLFTCGQYPILFPTNFLALFLNDNQFFLFKLIEPYIIGFFFTLILFINTFKIKWYYALFGALYYMSLIFGKHATIAQSPLFLWGCAIFPAMIYCYQRLTHKDIFLATAVVGSLIAVQFAAQGVQQFPQLIVWWLIFLTVQCLLGWGKGQTLKNCQRWFLCCLLLIFMAGGLFGIQFIPTYQFSFHDSGRPEGYYPINTLPFIRSSHLVDDIPWLIFQAPFFLNKRSSNKGIFVLLLMMAVVSIVNRRKIKEIFKKDKLLSQICISTLIYLLTPSLAELIVLIIPVSEWLFQPLTKFSFKYGIFVLDFCIALILSIILNHEDLAIPKKQTHIAQSIFIWFLPAAASILSIIPIGMAINPALKNYLLSLTPLWGNFIPLKLSMAFIIMLISFAIIFFLCRRPKRTIWKQIFYTNLIALGFFSFISCYFDNSKGQQTNVNDYLMATPEYSYYKKAAGKFYLPFNGPLTMRRNYNLLYGVHGLSGFLALPPKRINNFISIYHQESQSSQMEYIPKFDIQRSPEKNAPWSLTTYFPVDFTTTLHDQPLEWEDFVRKISGEKYDIWARKNPPELVRFAQNLHIENLSSLVEQFNAPSPNTIMVEENDARIFGLKKTTLAPYTNTPPQYLNFVQENSDRILLEIKAPQETFVWIPEMYQRGWQVFANGDKINIFPAHYLFIGFKLSPGDYQIQMSYMPPSLGLGIASSVISLIVLSFLILMKLAPGRRTSDDLGHHQNKDNK